MKPDMDAERNAETADVTASRAGNRGAPQGLAAMLVSRLRFAFSRISVARKPRHLRLCESLSLGEKRLLAVIECDHERMLIAATPNGISLLRTLDASALGAGTGIRAGEDS